MLSFPKLQADEWEIFVLLFIQSSPDANWKPINSSNYSKTKRAQHTQYLLPAYVTGLSLTISLLHQLLLVPNTALFNSITSLWDASSEEEAKKSRTDDYV